MFQVESLAFLPQLFLSVGAIPFLLGKRDIAGTMLAQTFAFVTFNKVCTSQVSQYCKAIQPGLTAAVFSLVHGLPAVLPAKFVLYP